VGNLSSSFNSNLFLFSAENGGIYGWRGALGTTAETLLPPSSSVYKGLAISGSTLYAAKLPQRSDRRLRGRLRLPAPSGGSNLPRARTIRHATPQREIYVTFAMQDGCQARR